MTAPLATAEPTPSWLSPGHPFALGHEGRAHLLNWLHTAVISDTPITADSWREAWGKAADYQTVVNAEAALAVTP